MTSKPVLFVDVDGVLSLFGFDPAGELPGPFHWIDDNMDDSVLLWQRGRKAPTLLVETKPATGMTDDHVDELLAWAAVQGA